MKPHGFRADVAWPALLNIHGGPHAQYGHGFFDELQVYAGAGYGVIYANPRGSQGYGEAFTRAVIGDWGGGDFADVMAGLDQALARHAWIDAARLGVMGGSYGASSRAGSSATTIASRPPARSARSTTSTACSAIATSAICST